MAQLFDDFSDESIGALPLGSTLMRGSASGDYSVQSEGGVNQLRYLAAAGGTTARGLKYSLASSGATEIYAVVTEPVNTTPQSGRLIVFASDAPDNEYGLYLDFLADQLVVYRRVAGTFTSIASGVAGALLNGTYYCVRFRVTPGSPNTLKARVWAEGGSEPSTWAIETSNANLTLTTGWIGHVGFQQSASVFYKEIGIGTAGDAAPTEPVATRRRPPLLLTPW